VGGCAREICGYARRYGLNMAGSSRRLCIFPRPSGVGGMVSFRRRLGRGLTARGIEVCDALDPDSTDAILVIGGTRRLADLYRAHRRGVPIVQRLDGMNWLHRKLRTGFRHFLRAEWGNWLLSTIRSRLADRVVYQSEFARQWWERVYGPTKVPTDVILNGIDLDRYNPNGPGVPPEDCYRLLMVEGALEGGYELGLEHGVRLAETLAQEVSRPVTLMVVGRVSQALRRKVETGTSVRLRWEGLVPQERIPEIDRSAHLLFSADLNPACPNTVIEALACGLPVVAFDTGALPELVTQEAGCLASYGGDPWKLDPPDIAGLAYAARTVLKSQAHYRAGARSRAEANLGLNRMVDAYLTVLGWT
jgi:glycosyltransferase involved in cell wall biosynthesis